MVVNKAHALLIQLGLAENEAKAYLSLLKIQPATAYELAKVSGIPSSKIYEVVNRLIERSIFLAMPGEQQRGKAYCAIAMQDFLARCENDTQRIAKELAATWQQDTDAEVDIIWPLDNTADLESKAHSLIDNCRQTCLISLWPEELERLGGSLAAAEQRGVKIALVHFGKPAQFFGATYYHPAEETLYEEKQGRGLTLVTDSEQVLTATYLANGQVQGHWSKNQTFVTVAEDYIRHDVYITKVTSRLNAEVKAHFGEDYQQLRDIFTP